MKTKAFRFACAAALLALVALTAACGKTAKAPAKSTAPPSSAAASGAAPTTPGVNNTGLPLNVPNGVTMSIYASGLGDPRVIAWDPQGTMLVSEPGNGQVVALPDRDGNGVSDGTAVVVSGLNNPHGIAFSAARPGKVYIAETDQLAAYDYDPVSMTATNKQKIADLPPDGEHITRTIMFLPPPNDSTLLVAVGSSQNAGFETDPRRAAINAVQADGTGFRQYATGLRNSVFQAINPSTGQIWATEMGRDNLGDAVPPDEINIIQDGSNYGWPVCYGKNVLDTTVVTNVPPGTDPTAGKTPSYIDIQAHSAPLGLDFFAGKNWPASYGTDMLVAFHGSWNRSVPTGDKVVRYHLDDKGNVQGVDDFITGWMQPDGSYLGRPVGISLRPNGVGYISDDKLGHIYLIKATQ